MVEIQDVSFAYTLPDGVRPPQRGMDHGVPSGYEKEQGMLSHIDLQTGQGGSKWDDCTGGFPRQGVHRKGLRPYF